MIISKLLRILIVLTLFIFISSCDLFLPAPVGRDNPDDPDVQIRYFTSVMSGSDSILAVWEWREASPEIADSRVIDEIWIVHSENDPPKSRFPGDSDDVQKFDSTSFWKAEWINLNSNEEHYFALYAKEKGGTWLAPKHTSIYLNSNGSMKSGSAWYDEPFLYAQENTPFNQTNYFLDSTHWAIIRYNLDGPNDGVILNGNITISIGGAAAPAGDVWIVPLRWRVPEGTPWDDVDNNDTMDMDNAIKFYMDNAGTDFNIEIEKLLNLARLYGSNAIALVPAETGGAGFNLNFVDISYNYWESY